jgi:hypothetical protein
MLQYSRLWVPTYWLYSYKKYNQVWKTLHAYLRSCIQRQITNTHDVKLVLATVPTCWNSSGLGLELEPNCWNGFTTCKPRTVAFVPGSTSKPGHCKPRFLPPIEYLSPDCIVTWLMCRLCSFSQSFTSCVEICYMTNIHWVAIENPPISLVNARLFHSHS